MGKLRCMAWSTCCFLLIAGCAKSRPQARAPSPSVAIEPTPLTSATVERPREPDSVVIAPDMRRLCGIGDQMAAPKFAFDSADLEQDEGLAALQKLATCLTSGPLRGRPILLTGRADPRGTTEYNMVLGASRAQSVHTYLATLGVDTAALRTTSRGELDATGSDETSWALDRRVDIQLADANALSTP